MKNNLADFLSLSEEYDLAPLKLKTEQAAIRMLTADNMVDIYILSGLHHAGDLREATELFIKENKSKLLASPLNYPTNVLKDILRLIVS